MIKEFPDVGNPTPAVASGVVAKSPPRKAARESRPDVTLNALTLIGEDRRRLIAEAAYFRAEQRGFVPGNEVEDWLAAEMEIDALLDDESR